MCRRCHRQRRQVVYYLVLDYLDRARLWTPLPPRRAAAVPKPIRMCLPSAEEKFFMNWEAGDPIRVNGSLKEWLRLDQ